MGTSHITGEVVYVRENCQYGKTNGGLRLMTAETFTGRSKKDEGGPPGKARATERVSHPDSGPDED